MFLFLFLMIDFLYDSEFHLLNIAEHKIDFVEHVILHNHFQMFFQYYVNLLNKDLQDTQAKYKENSSNSKENH